MGTDAEQELVALQLQQAKAELVNTMAEGALLKQQVRTQRAQLHGQMALAVVSLVTAALAAWSSCRSDRRSTATYQMTSAAVSSINSAQQQQYRVVSELRDYTVDAVESSSPIVLVVSSPLASSAVPPV